MDVYDHARLASSVREHDAFDDVLADYPAYDAERERNSETLFKLGFDEKIFARRIQTIYKIEEKRTGAMMPWGPLLKQNPIQLGLLRQLIQLLKRGGPLRVILVKGRKSGVSTLSSLLALEVCCQVSGYGVGVIAHSDAATQTIFRIIQRAYENFPMLARPELRSERTNRYEFGIRHKEDRAAGAVGLGSFIQTATAKGNYPFAGSTIRMLLLTEWAKYDTVGDINAQMRFILSALGSIPSVGHSVVIAESTANGQQGWGWETWKRATSKTVNNDGMQWFPIFISWLDDMTCRMFVNPEYDWQDWPKEDMLREAELIEHHKATLENLMFRRFQLSTTMNMDFDYFSQEFPTTADEAFLSSGRVAFPKRYLDAQQKNFREPIAKYSLDVTDSDIPTTSFEVESATHKVLP